MPYFALFYDLVDDYLERRPAHRAEHLRLAEAATQRGELVLAGALSDPADRAVLIFRAADQAAVEAFVAHDPYVTNGLVTHWEVRPWTVVIGSAFTAPESAGGS
jgi:uncharacterized protein YciI